MSKGTDLLKVTIDTTRELGVIGDELKIGEKCFTALSSHLNNADGVFLPLSLYKGYVKLTSDILEEALKQGMNYEPAPFKRLQNKHYKQQLTKFSIATLDSESGCRFLAANSPLFHYLGLGGILEDIASLYKRADSSRWKGNAKLIPDYNQACKRLVKNLKHSMDINTLAETREGSPRSGKGKNVMKEVSL